jgi:phosphoglycerate dehydrogenase-like enzyme
MFAPGEEQRDLDPEPPTPALRLLKAPNVVLSPHVAGVTRETLVRIALAAVQNVTGFLAGEPPRDVVSWKPAGAGPG